MLFHNAGLGDGSGVTAQNKIVRTAAAAYTDNDVNICNDRQKTPRSW
jgi:hypothetical protein